MLLELKYDFGQLVYLKTDTDQRPRMVIGMNARPHGVIFELSFGGTSSWHYEIEISETADSLKSIIS